MRLCALGRARPPGARESRDRGLPPARELNARPPRQAWARALAWVLLVGGFAAWLFSATLFPGNGPLYDAVAAGDAAAVRRLLAQGADPNSSAAPLTLTRTSTQRYRVSPLVYALRRGQGEAALALIAAGADPAARDHDGKTALQLASNARLPEVAEALRRRGAR